MLWYLHYVVHSSMGSPYSLYVRILYIVLRPVFKVLRQYTYVSKNKTALKFTRNDVVQWTKTRAKKTPIAVFSNTTYIRDK
jgi:hypothetical protein